MKKTNSVKTDSFYSVFTGSDKIAFSNFAGDIVLTASDIPTFSKPLYYYIHSKNNIYKTHFLSVRRKSKKYFDYFIAILKKNEKIIKIQLLNSSPNLNTHLTNSLIKNVSKYKSINNGVNNEK